MSTKPGQLQVRGRDRVRLKARWASCRTIFRRATATPTALGEGDWVRSNPLQAIFVLVRHAEKGHRDKTANGKRARSKKRTQAARGAREPWLLVACAGFATLPPSKLVRLYRQRIQIEESFRDMKSQHFGAGLERSCSNGSGRFTVLVLIASLAASLLCLLGTAADELGLEQRMRPGARKRRAYSRLFLARLILTLDSCRGSLMEVIALVGVADQWVASNHDALFAG